MKILMVTDRMSIGGAETHVKALCRELILAGDEVSLMCAGGEYSEQVKEMGGRIIIAPLDKRDSSSVIKSLKLLKKEIKLHHVVHAHTRFTSLLIKLARGRAHIPALVTTAHLPFEIKGLSRFTHWGDYTLAVSDDIANYLIQKYKIKSERIYLTKNGIEDEFFSTERCPSRMIVHVSRLDADRSLTASLLIDAMTKIRIRYPDYKAIIVGDGEDYPALSEKADKINQELGDEVIKMVGKTTDVKEYLKTADIFLGVSRALLEAIAMGIPSIVCGNEGYGGILSYNNIEALSLSNFCARGWSKPNSDRLERDIFSLIGSEDRNETLYTALRGDVLSNYSSKSSANDAKGVYLRAYTPPRVCLVGYFGYGNLGDEATLKLIKKALIFRGIDNIITLTHGKRRSKDELDRESIIGIINAILKSDVIVFAGGNLIQSETSRRSLKYYGAIINFASFFSKRIYFISSGFGDFRGYEDERLSRRYLRKCHFIGARTEGDFEIAREICPDKSRLMPDICFLSSHIRSSLSRQHFALITSTGFDIDTDEVKSISLRFGLSPLIISLFPRQERRGALQLGRALKSPVIFPKDERELILALGECGFTVSGRLHGAIFSLISHTPCYLLGKNSKNRRFTEEIKRRCRDLSSPSPVRLFYHLGDIAPISGDFSFTSLLDSLRDEVSGNLDEIFNETV